MILFNGQAVVAGATNSTLTIPDVIAMIASFAAVIAAIAAGIFTSINTGRINNHGKEVEKLKNGFNQDIEKLKAKLGHGQLVSSSQWNAEFGAYQAIWRGIVAVRAISTKLVLREGELVERGLPQQYLSNPDRVNIRKELLTKFVNAATELLMSIHDNAPFYPFPIRKAANDTHAAAHELINKHLTVLVHNVQGIATETDEQFIAESKLMLMTIVAGADLVESLIRERLAAVTVVNF